MKLKNKLIVALLLVASSVTIIAMRGDDRTFSISKQLNILASIYRDVNMLYVDTVNPEKLMKEGIDAMLSSLDPYTVYYPEQETEDVKFMTTGEYAGIGAVIGKKGDYVIIRNPFRGSPAFKSGLKPGDKILAVDGVNVKGYNVVDVTKLLKGAPGKELNLKIDGNDGKVKHVKLIRENVQTPAIPYYGMVDNNVGYIYLTGFTDKSAPEVKKALIDLKSKGAQSMILDLRGNSGGLLNQAIDIVGFFMPRNTLVVTTKGKVKQAESKLATSNNPILPDMPLAVLINSLSASASEIVAGSLQDHDRAVLIGKRSFGKGLVQTVRDLPYNTKIKMTTAKYYIPSGRLIQAIDYSNRNEDGSVGKIPDSLMTAYKTANGRIVYDGGGILPDVEMEVEKFARISQEIVLQDFSFDFVTDYMIKHPTIAPISSFVVDESIYNSFKSFLKERKFDYQTASQEQLKKLIETAKAEKYYDANKEYFDSLTKDLEHSIDRDMTISKDQIIEILSNEFITAYYQIEGVAEYQVKGDKEIERAIEILNDKSAYNKLLKINQ